MKQQQPHTVEAEYYPDGTEKRYYKKVEHPYPQVFQLVIGMSAIAISLCLLTITYQSSQSNHCRDNYGNISPRY